MGQPYAKRTNPADAVLTWEANTVPFNTTEFRNGADMEQVPTWLAAAVTAAGLTTAYNAEDWDRNTGAPDNPAEPQVQAFPPLPF